MLRICVHDLLVHCVLSRGNHRALLGYISCLLVQAILLLDHWKVGVLSTCCVRGNLLVRLELIRLLKHVLSILHYNVLLVLVR